MKSTSLNSLPDLCVKESFTCCRNWQEWGPRLGRPYWHTFEILGISVFKRFISFTSFILFLLWAKAHCGWSTMCNTQFQKAVAARSCGCRKLLLTVFVCVAASLSRKMMLPETASSCCNGSGVQIAQKNSMGSLSFPKRNTRMIDG